MTTLYGKCVFIYQNARDGKAAVEAYVRENHPDVPWARCGACEADEPYDDWGDCLVCGSSLELEPPPAEG